MDVAIVREGTGEVVTVTALDSLAGFDPGEGMIAVDATGLPAAAGGHWTPGGGFAAPEPLETPLDDLRAAAVRRLALMADEALAPFVAEYSALERETWRVQEAEARAVLGDTLNASDAEFLMMLCDGVYQRVRPLAEKVVTKATSFAQLAAGAIAIRRNAASAVGEADTADDIAAAIAVAGDQLAALTSV